jgi:hypothetical protein
LVWWIAAARLAEPDAPWAGWFYDSNKVERALHRFGHGRGASRRRFRALVAVGLTLLVLPLPLSYAILLRS